MRVVGVQSEMRTEIWTRDSQIYRSRRSKFERLVVVALKG